MKLISLKNVKTALDKNLIIAIKEPLKMAKTSDFVSRVCAKIGNATRAVVSFDYKGIIARSYKALKDNGVKFYNNFADFVSGKNGGSPLYESIRNKISNNALSNSTNSKVGGSVLYNSIINKISGNTLCNSSGVNVGGKSLSNSLGANISGKSLCDSIGGKVNNPLYESIRNKISGNSLSNSVSKKIGGSALWNSIGSNLSFQVDFLKDEMKSKLNKNQNLKLYYKRTYDYQIVGERYSDEFLSQIYHEDITKLLQNSKAYDEMVSRSKI